MDCALASEPTAKAGATAAHARWIKRILPRTDLRFSRTRADRAVIIFPPSPMIAVSRPALTVSTSAQSKYYYLRSRFRQQVSPSKAVNGIAGWVVVALRGLERQAMRGLGDAQPTAAHEDVH